ncbi:DUF4349 domain-containing protein [Solirubrobacter ginsenosidimutans]|uniref:DUF4349 domain-containing protein n=1 Tax=Solirubrobacter ginsenosidimutans TaxID=490573 RepID=A0A9X3MXZ1_9ACTN|nr:DUF4349 domain-containing protein [Solirubrobacter ginsenosidimutans]MDA0163192.1 DUF4349 domain-containing protein [Solirubrobacter ginsenosidimutans]
MPDLEMLLRDVRPVPDPVWAEKLDAKVAARFPGPVPPWKKKLQALRDHFAAFALASATAATLLLIVVVIAKNIDTSGSDDSGASATSMKAPPSADSASSGSSAASPKKSATDERSAAATLPRSAAGGSSGAAGGGRAVLSNASLTITTRPGEVETTTDRAIRITDTLGGYVQTSSTSVHGSTASASLTLKLPADKLDSGIAQLSKLGHVSARSQQAEDVTDQRDSLEAAVRDARADRDGLRSRLAKAATDKERSRLRALLDRATRRVTARERAVAQLNQAVSYASVDLSIEGTRKATVAPVPGGRWTPGDAVKDAGRVLEVIAGVLVIGLAILLPLGVLAGLAAYANRSLTRRRRERALEAS